MARQSHVAQIWYPQWNSENSGAITTATANLSAVDAKIGLLFECPRDVTIDGACVGIGGAPGNDNLIRTELWSVDSSGQPPEPDALITGAQSGTYNTNNTDDQWVDPGSFSTPYDASRGELLAILVRCSTHVAGNLQISSTQDIDPRDALMGNFSFTDSNGLGSYSYPNNQSNVVPYDDSGVGIWLDNQEYIINRNGDLSTLNVDNDGANRRVGIRFRSPVPFILGGMWYQSKGNQQHAIELYNDAGTLLQAFQTVSGENHYNTSTSVLCKILDDTYDIEKDTWYRLVISGAEAATNPFYFCGDLPVKVWNKWPMEMHGCLYTSGSVWVDYDNVTDGYKQFVGGLGIQGFGEGGGGGGPTVPALLEGGMLRGGLKHLSGGL